MLAHFVFSLPTLNIVKMRSRNIIFFLYILELSQTLRVKSPITKIIKNNIFEDITSIYLFSISK